MMDEETGRPTVIKVGGSLLDWPELPARLASFLAGWSDSHPDDAERLVLLAGGGPVADLVRMLDRACGLGESHAHWLAIRALDFTANLLAAMVANAVVVSHPRSLPSFWNAHRVPVLAPEWLLREVDAKGPNPLPESWNVTSDSIAARIAEQLCARRLILVKSASVRAGTSREDAARLGVVDPYFPTATLHVDSVEMISLRENEPALRELTS